MHTRILIQIYTDHRNVQNKGKEKQKSTFLQKSNMSNAYNCLKYLLMMLIVFQIQQNMLFRYKTRVCAQNNLNTLSSMYN